MALHDYSVSTAIQDSVASLEKVLIRENALNTLINNVKNENPMINPEQMNDNSKLRYLIFYSKVIELLHFYLEMKSKIK